MTKKFILVHRCHDSVLFILSSWFGQVNIPPKKVKLHHTFHKLKERAKDEQRLCLSSSIFRVEDGCAAQARERVSTSYCPLSFFCNSVAWLIFPPARNYSPSLSPPKAEFSFSCFTTPPLILRSESSQSTLRCPRHQMGMPRAKKWPRVVCLVIMRTIRRSWDI